MGFTGEAVPPGIKSGEIVVVNERYGVRISEVTRPEEKIGERRE